MLDGPRVYAAQASTVNARGLMHGMMTRAAVILPPQLLKDAQCRLYLLSFSDVNRPLVLPRAYSF